MTKLEIHQYLRTPGNNELWYFPFQVARDLSDLAAALLYDLQWRQEQRRKKLVKDGKKWSFDSACAFAKKHRYASEEGIRDALLRLEREGLVEIEKKGKYNKKKYDKKWWFHVPARALVKARARRIRYNPTIAATLDIPKAALLENLRHQLHEPEAGEYGTLAPENIGLPYDPKTMRRHLEDLVNEGILERHPQKKHRYRIPPARPSWMDDMAPITVAPASLLPSLPAGGFGLLVGHCGTGKTSLSTFIAVQNALAGKRVLFVSLEERPEDIINRMYAQEYGANYSALHRGDREAEEIVNQGHKASKRTKQIGPNVRVIGHGRMQSHELYDEIQQQVDAGFVPDLIIVDQLEFVDVVTETSSDGSTVEMEGGELPEALGISLAAGQVIRESIPAGPHTTWVLHQVVGAPTQTFAVKDVAGAEHVTNLFDAVVGIGRAPDSSGPLRFFSLTKQARFEKLLEADFPHMRFKPKEE